MSIAKILAPLNGTANDSVALATAFAVAKAQKAYVDAVFINPDPREAIPVTEMPISGDIVQEIVDSAELGRKQANGAARESFSVAAANWNVKIVSTPEKLDCVTATFRDVMGHPRKAIAKLALLSDLVIFPPLLRDDLSGLHDAFIDVLTKTSRPVLLCAEKAPASVGQNVLIGWDGGAAAAQALIAALPILEKADIVRFASIHPEGQAEKRLAEARQYLALHGMSARDTLVVAPRNSIADELFRIAHSHACDLLVVGGYGHSRMMETVFGGTTRQLVSHPETSLFLAH